MASRVVYNAIVNYYKRILLVYSPLKPLRVNINGKAKIGKSYFIIVLSKALSKLVVITSKPSLLIRAAFTSITAFGINGQTIYNLLKLPVQYLFKDLLPASLTPL